MTASETLAYALLTPCIAAFRMAHPGIVLDLVMPEMSGFDVLARVLLRSGLFAYLLLLVTVAIYLLAGDVLSIQGSAVFGNSGFGSFLTHLLLLMVAPPLIVYSAPWLQLWR